MGGSFERSGYRRLGRCGPSLGRRWFGARAQGAAHCRRKHSRRSRCRGPYDIGTAVSRPLVSSDLTSSVLYPTPSARRHKARLHRGIPYDCSAVPSLRGLGACAGYPRSPPDDAALTVLWVRRAGLSAIRLHGTTANQNWRRLLGDGRETSWQLLRCGTQPDARISTLRLLIRHL